MAIGAPSVTSTVSTAAAAPTRVCQTRLQPAANLHRRQRGAIPRQALGQCRSRAGCGRRIRRAFTSSRRPASAARWRVVLAEAVSRPGRMTSPAAWAAASRSTHTPEVSRPAATAAGSPSVPTAALLAIAPAVRPCAPTTSAPLTCTIGAAWCALGITPYFNHG